MSRKFFPSDLICPECGNIMTISRGKFNVREKYHIKDLYCIKCDKVTKHIELGDADIVKKELEFKSELTEIEKQVYDLTHEEKCKVKSI